MAWLPDVELMLNCIHSVALMGESTDVELLVDVENISWCLRYSVDVMSGLIDVASSLLLSYSVDVEFWNSSAYVDLVSPCCVVWLTLPCLVDWVVLDLLRLCWVAQLALDCLTGVEFLSLC